MRQFAVGCFESAQSVGLAAAGFGGRGFAEGRHKDEKAMKRMFDPALAVVSKFTGSDAKSLSDHLNP